MVPFFMKVWPTIRVLANIFWISTSSPDDILQVEWETTPGYEMDSLVTSEIQAKLVTSYARRVRALL
jgi:hypothetical protein